MLSVDSEISALSHHTLTPIFKKPYKLGDLYTRKGMDKEIVSLALIDCVLEIQPRRDCCFWWEGQEREADQQCENFGSWLESD